MRGRAPAVKPSSCGVCVAETPLLTYDPDLGVWACARCRTEPVRLGGYSFSDGHPTSDGCYQKGTNRGSSWGGSKVPSRR